MKKENLVKNKAYYQNLKARYLNAAKEANGDRVMKEYNLQFVEHYTRLIADKFPPQQQPQPKPQGAQADQSSEQTDPDSAGDASAENRGPCVKRRGNRRPCMRRPKVESEKEPEKEETLS